MKYQYSGVVANTIPGHILGNDFCGDIFKQKRQASCKDEMIGYGDNNSLKQAFLKKCEN